MVLQFVGEYVVAFLLKTPFLTKRGFLFYTFFIFFMFLIPSYI